MASNSGAAHNGLPLADKESPHYESEGSSRFVSPGFLADSAGAAALLDGSAGAIDSLLALLEQGWQPTKDEQQILFDNAVSLSSRSSRILYHRNYPLSTEYLQKAIAIKYAYLSQEIFLHASSVVQQPGRSAADVVLIAKSLQTFAGLEPRAMVPGILALLASSFGGGPVWDELWESIALSYAGDSVIITISIGVEQLPYDRADELIGAFVARASTKQYLQMCSELQEDPLALMVLRRSAPAQLASLGEVRLQELTKHPSADIRQAVILAINAENEIPHVSERGVAGLRPDVAGRP